MTIQPPQNVIDCIYRLSKKLSHPLILNMQPSIFRSLLEETNGLSFVISDNQDLNINTICSQFNINGVISSDYIRHSQQKNIYHNYHIQDMVMIIDPPHSMLKKEDIMLLEERLRDSKKICIGSNIYNKWPKRFIETLPIEPGLIDEELNIDNNRKKLIILSDNSPASQRISAILYHKYQDVKVIGSYLDYDSLNKILNQYRVCLNLNASIDSIFALQSGCITISKEPYLNEVYKYNTLEDISKLIEKGIESFDIKRQKDTSLQITKNFPYSVFEQTLTQTIIDNLKEPFVI